MRNPRFWTISVFLSILCAIYGYPLPDNIVMNPEDSDFSARDDSLVMHEPKESTKRSTQMQAKSEFIFFPEDQYFQTPTKRPRPTPPEASLILPETNSPAFPGSETGSSSSQLVLPGAAPSSSRPAIPDEDSILLIPSSSSEETEGEKTENDVTGQQLIKFVTWLQNKGLPENYTDPTIDIKNIKIGNFALSTGQRLKCPPPKVWLRGECVYVADF